MSTVDNASYDLNNCDDGSRIQGLTTSIKLAQYWGAMIMQSNSGGRVQQQTRPANGPSDGSTLQKAGLGSRDGSNSKERTKDGRQEG